MDKTAWFQVIFLVSLLMALLPRMADLGSAASRWMTLAAFGLLGVGLVWAAIDFVLWLLDADRAAPR